MVTLTPQTEIAAGVETLRSSRGIPVARLSDATGIPRTTLARKLPRGDDFTVSELRAISIILDVPLTYWFGAHS